MINKDKLNDCATAFINTLPKEVAAWHDAIKDQFTQQLQSTLQDLSLVTREEFEVQTQVLAKTRAKLTALEEKLNTLTQKS